MYEDLLSIGSLVINSVKFQSKFTINFASKKLPVLTLLVLKAEYSMRTMSAPNIARTSASLVITIQGNWRLVFLKLQFKRPVSSQY